MDITLQRILSLIPHKENGDFEHGSLKKFAQSIGLKSGNLIADWIAGRSYSYKKKIHEISAKYDVSVEWLEGKTDQKEKLPGIKELTVFNMEGKDGAYSVKVNKNNSKQLSELIKESRDLSPEKIEVIIQLVKNMK